MNGGHKRLSVRIEEKNCRLLWWFFKRFKKLVREIISYAIGIGDAAAVRRVLGEGDGPVPGDGIVGVVSGYAQAPLPVMHGQHHEAAVLANAIPGTTVDVPRVSHLLARALPGNAAPQSFVVDTWSFERIADFYLDRDRPAAATRAEVVATVAAFNAATVLTL